MAGPEVVEVQSHKLAVAKNESDNPNYGQVIFSLLDQVWPLIRTSGVKFGHNVVLYQGGKIIEAGVQVEGNLPYTGEVYASSTPGGRAATLAYFGPYDGIGAAAQRLYDWCKSQNLQLQGNYWEIYGDPTPDPAQTRTDLFFQLAN